MPSFCVIWWSCIALLCVGDGLAVVAALCPPKCSCNDDTLVVICNNTNLDMVPITLNPGVRHLYLIVNQIRTLIATLGFYKDLEFLDLSHNQLSKIETRAFDAQEKLQTLILNYNSLPNVSSDTFFGLKSLKTLHVDHNKLQTLPASIFVHLRSLELLDLSSNRISTVSPNAFEGLVSLRVLNLNNNLLTKVPTSSFAVLVRLKTLDIGSNALTTIAPKSLASLNSLQYLKVDGCALQDPLPSAAFEGLINLRTLSAKNNSLRTIPSVALTSMERLEHLDLGLNALDELPAHAFKGLRFLRSVNISHARRLVVVRKYAFSANTDLERVNLNDNARLNLLEVGAFEGLTGLRYLSIRGNAFYSLSQPQLMWEDLDALDLRDNPLHCNCSLLWLRDLLASRNLSVEGASTVATCQAPFRLIGRSIGRLSADDLSCFFADVRQHVLIGIGSVIILVCLATLVIVVLKYRKPVTSVLKDKWSDGALRRKEHQYEKTNDDDENNILHATAQLPMKMTPVTEL
uniref:LRRCT domain-containing protein n=1 Tax=Strigamia maritima TaxID=126957 RepID=T1IVG8_STRMM